MPFATRLYNTKETGFIPFYLKLEFMIPDIKGITTNMEGIYQQNFLAFLDLHLIYRKLHIFFRQFLLSMVKVQCIQCTCNHYESAKQFSFHDSRQKVAKVLVKA